LWNEFFFSTPQLKRDPLGSSNMIQLSSPLIVGAAFAGAGIYALARGFRDLARAIDSEDWPAVDGEILDAGVDTDFASRGRMYSAAVRYRYSAGGVAHEGDRIAFGGPIETSWRGPAEKTAARYRKGAAVKVRVSPTDPSQSVLEPGAKWYIYVVIIAGAIFLAVGIRMIINAVG